MNNQPTVLETQEEVFTPNFDELERELPQPETLVDDLDLSQHTHGSWPSSKNVSQ